jgi:hypothetical protein
MAYCSRAMALFLALFVEPRPQPAKVADRTIMILKLTYVASTTPSAPTAIMPADFVLRNAPAWRVARDGYELILRPWHALVSTQGRQEYVEFIKGLCAPRSL